jgi:peptide/nickel transport system substrate-binding protein
MARVGKIEKSGGCSAIFCFAALFCFAPLFSACSDSSARSQSVSSKPVTLTIGFPYQTGEDPLHGVQQAARLLSFEGLIYITRDGRPQPKLAEKWDESPDGLSWSLKLRSNAFFHDGSKVDSRAVKDSLERSMTSLERDLAPGLSDITGIETPSSNEVLIRLKARSTFLLEDLSVAITKLGPNQNLIGTGPFVTDSTAGSEIVMRSVPNYYRERPEIDRVVWKTYPAVRTAWAAMMRGEIDFLYEVSPDTLEFIQPEASVQVFSFLRNYVYTVGLNSARDQFKDARIRRALNYAIDRKLLIDQALKGHGRPANGPAWPLHWAYDQSVPQYSYDPSRAAALLDDAHVPKIAGNVQPGGVPARFHFTCLLPQNIALWERMALLVQRNLSEIGVDMQLESVPFGTFNERIAARDFDAVIVELIVGNSASRPYVFWHSQGRLNTWGVKSPLIDHALDGIRRAPNDAAYRDGFREFQIDSLDAAPAIFLALGETSRAVSKRFQVNALSGSDILPTIADWRLADASRGTTN